MCVCLCVCVSTLYILISLSRTPITWSFGTLSSRDPVVSRSSTWLKLKFEASNRPHPWTRHWLVLYLSSEFSWGEPPDSWVYHHLPSTIIGCMELPSCHVFQRECEYHTHSCHSSLPLASNWIEEFFESWKFSMTTSLNDHPGKPHRPSSQTSLVELQWFTNQIKLLRHLGMIPHIETFDLATWGHDFVTHPLSLIQRMTLPWFFNTIISCKFQNYLWIIW